MNTPPIQTGLAATGAHAATGGGRIRYDSLSMTLHWVTAGLIVIQFGLAQTWDYFGKPTQHVMVAAHMSFGLLLTAVILTRIVWRLTPGHRVRAATQGWVEIASKSVHYALYALVAAEVSLGILIPWTGGKPLIFFGLPIESPMAAIAKDTHHEIGEVHNYVAWTIIVLATGHACAALFHQYVLHDGLLNRMWPRDSRSEAPQGE